jgi:hypothetical protein
MSHFAQLDQNNVVIQVAVGDNSMPNEGYDWFIKNLGGRWVQTSYNGNIRKNYAQIGGFYDEKRDAFIPPKPAESWVLDEITCTWKAPIDYPADGLVYVWNENKIEWELLNDKKQ